MTAGVVCGSCGTGLRENAKFCDECGARAAVSGDTAEYKQVTVLFADVVHSMDIAAAGGGRAVARDHGRAGRPGRCGGHKELSTWPTVTRLKATSFSGLR